jgi:uncharacterized protein
MLGVIRKTLAGVLLLISGGLAFAQQAPVQQVPAQPAPPTAAAPALAPISEAHLAAAREVVIGSGLSRGFDGMIPQIADQIRGGFSRTRPELIKDMEEALRPIIGELSKQTDQMITSASRLFAVRLSEAELKEIGAFFKTAAGQKYVNTQGPMLNELFTEMQVFSQTLGNVMMDRLREEMRKKGHQL